MTQFTFADELSATLKQNKTAAVGVGLLNVLGSEDEKVLRASIAGALEVKENFVQVGIEAAYGFAELTPEEFRLRLRTTALILRSGTDFAKMQALAKKIREEMLPKSGSPSPATARHSDADTPIETIDKSLNFLHELMGQRDREAKEIFQALEKMPVEETMQIMDGYSPAAKVAAATIVALGQLWRGGGSELIAHTQFVWRECGAEPDGCISPLFTNVLMVLLLQYCRDDEGREWCTQDGLWQLLQSLQGEQANTFLLGLWQISKDPNWTNFETRAAIWIGAIRHLQESNLGNLLYYRRDEMFINTVKLIDGHSKVSADFTKVVKRYFSVLDDDAMKDSDSRQLLSMLLSAYLKHPHALCNTDWGELLKDCLKECLRLKDPASTWDGTPTLLDKMVAAIIQFVTDPQNSETVVKEKILNGCSYDLENYLNSDIEQIRNKMVLLPLWSDVFEPLQSSKPLKLVDGKLSTLQPATSREEYLNRYYCGCEDFVEAVVESNIISTDSLISWIKRSPRLEFGRKYELTKSFRSHDHLSDLITRSTSEEQLKHKQQLAKRWHIFEELARVREAEALGLQEYTPNFEPPELPSESVTAEATQLTLTTTANTQKETTLKPLRKNASNKQAVEHYLPGQYHTVELLAQTESMNDGEAIYWLNLLGEMTPAQKEKLIGVLQKEQDQLSALELADEKATISLPKGEAKKHKLDNKKRNSENIRRIKARWKAIRQHLPSHH